MPRPSDERGQTTAEYLGLILLVGALVAALLGSGLGGRLADGIETAICRISGGDACGDERAAKPERCLTTRSTRTSNLNGTIAVVRIDKDSTLIREDFSDGTSRFTVIDKSSAAGEVYAGVKAQAANHGVDWSASAELGASLAGAKVFEARTPQEADAFQQKIKAAGGLDGVLRDVAGADDVLGPLGKLNDLALDAVGVDDDEDLPEPRATYVEASAFARGNLEGGAEAGAFGGAELKGLISGAGVVKVISSGREKGDAEVSLEIEAAAAAALTGATLGPGANGKAKVTATIKFDAQNGYKPDELELKAVAGYTGSFNTSLSGSRLSDVGKTLAEGSFGATAGKGRGVEFGATLDLEDRANLGATLDVLLRRDPASAARLAQRIDQDGELSLDTYDLAESQAESGLKGGVGVSVGGGGSSASSTESGRSGSVRPAGGTFEPKVCKGPPA